jgi:hypothetical protein
MQYFCKKKENVTHVQASARTSAAIISHPLCTGLIVGEEKVDIASITIYYQS